MMLGASLEDWEKANESCIEAETAWHIARNRQPRDTTTAAAESKHAFAEFRDGLDRLRRALGQDWPEDLTDIEDPDDVVAERLSRHYAKAEEAERARDANEGEK